MTTTLHAAVILIATVLLTALGLVVAEVAGATPIFPTLVGKKAEFAWTPASGPVVDYGVMLIRPRGADAFWGWTTSPGVTITAAPGDIYGVAVWGRDGTGRAGPISDRSILVRVIPEPAGWLMLAVGVTLVWLVGRGR
jgi:hypothetical protein